MVRDCFPLFLASNVPTKPALWVWEGSHCQLKQRGIASVPALLGFSAAVSPSLSFCIVWKFELEAPWDRGLPCLPMKFCTVPGAFNDTMKNCIYYIKKNPEATAMQGNLASEDL